MIEILKEMIFTPDDSEIISFHSEDKVFLDKQR